LSCFLKLRSGTAYRQPLEPRFYRVPVIVSRPGSVMAGSNGIVTGTPSERLDLDVTCGNLACSTFAPTAQRGHTNLAGDEAGF
jgi:hypothetical protein